jgi:hypothetical protein
MASSQTNRSTPLLWRNTLTNAMAHKITRVITNPCQRYKLIGECVNSIIREEVGGEQLNNYIGAGVLTESKGLESNEFHTKT